MHFRPKAMKMKCLHHQHLKKTLIQKQEILTTTGAIIEQQGKGRHDPCVVPRAVPIVEAMAALVIADYFLFAKLNK